MKFGRETLHNTGKWYIAKTLNFNRKVSNDQEFNVKTINKQFPKIPLLNIYGTNFICKDVVEFVTDKRWKNLMTQFSAYY